MAKSSTRVGKQGAWTLAVLLASALPLLPAPARAALELGAVAPVFQAKAALNGKVLDYSLANELRKGPVVLYFYPSAFSMGCSIEAHEFAEALGDFEAAGASVIGVSRDEIDIQKRFSVSACMGRFSVAADPGLLITKSYDAVMTTRPDYANRISYVIAPDGRIVYRYSSLNPGKHITNTLNAVREWQRSQKP
jgi:peroxiredoxin